MKYSAAAGNIPSSNRVFRLESLIEKINASMESEWDISATLIVIYVAWVGSIIMVRYLESLCYTVFDKLV